MRDNVDVPEVVVVPEPVTVGVTDGVCEVEGVDVAEVEGEVVAMPDTDDDGDVVDEGVCVTVTLVVGETDGDE